MSSVQGGKVSINVNGYVGSYFTTHRGLRQGDPLSPLLFNLVADALASMIEKAQRNGLIKGVSSHLIARGVSLLQYADDTVLLIEHDDSYILNLKFLLYCFEWTSGLKINYHKSEVYVIGVDKQEAIKTANMFNCKLGKFPLTYLGI